MLYNISLNDFENSIMFILFNPNLKIELFSAYIGYYIYQIFIDDKYIFNI